MLDFLFTHGGYTPHGYCLAWNPPVLWTHIVADVLIALSYFSIPAVILILLRARKDRELTAPAALFSAFILLCGLTHVVAIATLYVPIYGLQAALKALTAAVSVTTAIFLWQMLPAALRLPSRQALVAALSEQEQEVAERRKAEQAAESSQRVLAVKVAELETANRELAELTYAASHDLKSPVTSLGVLLGVMAEDHGKTMPEGAVAQMDKARALSGRIQTMIENLAEYSELLTEEFDPEAINLGDLAAQLAEELAERTEASGGRIEVGALPVIEGSREHLESLFRHLMVNALTYHRDGEAPVLRLSAVDRGAEVEVRFEDQGIGIDEKYRDRIFTLFNRLHGADEFPGTGLGLALCRRVAASHGGSISVEQTSGGGATFVLRLPRTTPRRTRQFIRSRSVRPFASPGSVVDGPVLV